MGKLTKWNNAYKDADFNSAMPAKILSENLHLLPSEGDALDLACGRAGNALYLAKKINHKLNVDAIDFSPVVIESLKEYVDANHLPVTPILRDVEESGLSDKNQKKYDLIVVSYFLNRSLIPEIINALKPNGLLYYQTWSQQKVDDSGPRNPDFRLEAGELLSWCVDLEILFYREEGQNGDTKKGTRNEAMIIARKLVSVKKQLKVGGCTVSLNREH